MMRTLREFIGFVFCSSFYVQLGYSFQGRFTEQPSNITAKEGQNIEMACAFQSVMPSVYLEIQWWFLRIPEERDYEENTDSQVLVDITTESEPDNEGIKISTVRVQGNDISHRLHISKVGKTDEGLYECLVTNANYGELLEYKALAYLRVLGPARPKKTSPLHLTDKKPRRNGPGAGRDGRSSSDPRRGEPYLKPTDHRLHSAKTQHHVRYEGNHQLWIVCPPPCVWNSERDFSIVCVDFTESLSPPRSKGKRGNVS